MSGELPAGFTLDKPAQSWGELPPGFTLDKPELSTWDNVSAFISRHAPDMPEASSFTSTAKGLAGEAAQAERGALNWQQLGIPSVNPGLPAMLDPVAGMTGGEYNAGSLVDAARHMYNSRLGMRDVPADYDFNRYQEAEQKAQQQFQEQYPATAKAIGGTMEAGLAHPYGLAFGQETGVKGKEPLSELPKGFTLDPVPAEPYPLTIYDWRNPTPVQHDVYGAGPRRDLYPDGVVPEAPKPAQSELGLNVSKANPEAPAPKESVPAPSELPVAPKLAPEVTGSPQAAGEVEPAQQTAAEGSPLGEAQSVPQTIGRGSQLGKPQDLSTPDESMRVQATPRLVELDDLKHASGDLQPRDTSTKESSASVRKIISEFNPQRLQPNPVSSDGPPSINGENVILAGNHRVTAIRSIYRDPANRDKAAAYRESLGPEAAGMKEPVLVMQLPHDLPLEDQKRFADVSNTSTVQGMSATEAAQRDVGRLGREAFGNFNGGNVTAAHNLKFFNDFMRRAVLPNELKEMSENGKLTKKGEDRIEAAILAAAYPEPDVLRLMLLDREENVKTLTNALREAAGKFAQLRAGVDAGTVSPKVDPTPSLLGAVKLISALRDEGVKIGDRFAQQDIFGGNGIPSSVEAWIRAFYKDDLSRTHSSLKIEDILRDHVDEALKHPANGLVPDETTAESILADIIAKRRAAESGDLFEGQAGNREGGAEQNPGHAGTAGDNGERAPQVGGEAQRPAPSEGSGLAGEREPKPATERRELPRISREEAARDYPIELGEGVKPPLEGRRGRYPDLSQVPEKAKGDKPAEYDFIHYAIGNGIPLQFEYAGKTRVGTPQRLGPVSESPGAAMRLHFYQTGGEISEGKNGSRQLKEGEGRWGQFNLSPTGVLPGEQGKRGASVDPEKQITNLDYAPLGTRFTIPKNAHNIQSGIKSIHVQVPYGEDEIHGGRMFALGGRSPTPPETDKLGYYSQALEAAKALPQAKGTPEQMLAQLKKAGVKDAEIQATRLGDYLDGMKSVTRDEIVRHLTENRVGLNEVQRAAHPGPYYALSGFYHAPERAIESFKQDKASPQQWMAELNKVQGAKGYIEHTGVKDFLEGKKSVSKQELLDFLRKNEPELEERTLSPETPEYRKALDEYHGLTSQWDSVNKALMLDRRYGGGPGVVRREKKLQELAPAIEEAKQRLKAAKQANITQYRGTRLSGGRNYQETLIRANDLEGEYEEPHWGEKHGNHGPVIAHVMTSDFEMPDGGRALTVNQLQSKYAAEKAEGKDVPGYAYEKDRLWQMAAKVALRKAVDGGYDALALPDAGQVEALNGAKAGSLRTLYEQKLPKFLADHVKQWGGKLEREWLPDSDSENGNLVVRITPEMRADLSEGGKGQAYATQGDLEAKDRAQEQLDAGRPVHVPDEIKSLVHDEMQPYLKALPEGTKIGALKSLEPSAEGKYTATFEHPDGSTFTLPVSGRDIRNRAFYDSGSDAVVSMRQGLPLGSDGGEGVHLGAGQSDSAAARKTFGAELGHEVVHAVWKHLPVSVKKALVDHSNSLGLMARPFKDYLKTIGEPSWKYAPEGVSIGDSYHDIYQDYPKKVYNDLMDQEAATHLMELSRHGALTEEQLAPVKHILDGILSGEYLGKSKGEGIASVGENAKIAASRKPANKPRTPTELKVYHGTDRTFDKFNTEEQFFSPRHEDANEYAMDNFGDRPNVIPAYVETKNFLTHDFGQPDPRTGGIRGGRIRDMAPIIEEAKKRGYEGLIAKNIFDTGPNGVPQNGDQIVNWTKGNVRSALSNNKLYALSGKKEGKPSPPPSPRSLMSGFGAPSLMRGQ